jgi:hypothetical protein
VAALPLHGLPVEVAASGAGEVEAATALHDRVSGKAAMSPPLMAWLLSAFS